MKRLKQFLYGLYWNGLQVWFRVLLSILYRARCEGRERMPPAGGALLLSNHQSYLDPLFLGIGSNRYLSYLARQELFAIPLFGQAIVSLRAIPINRDGMGLSGIKETLRQLKEEESRVADMTDWASVETERNFQLRARDRERKLLSKIDEALRRIDEGSYGFCEETQEPIGLRRLEARPIATLSIEAQERHERREKTYRDD